MSNDRISMRQLLVLLFVALLSPAIRTLPMETAAVAGEAGWLSSLVALPPALFIGWLFFRLLGRFPEGVGLAEAIEQTMGKILGKLLLLLYLLWGFALLCLNTRLYGQRILSTSYRNSTLWLFLAVLLAVVLWMAWGKLSAFARAGEVFFLILTLAFGAVLFFALFHVEKEHVFPIWTEDTLPVFWSSVPALSIMGYFVFGAFLAGGVTRQKGDKARALKWIAAFCILLTVLQFINLGNFGPALITRMEQPFFMMVKGIGIQGAFQRVESVVIALWVLSDLILVGLLTFACCTISQRLFHLKEKKQAAPVVVGLAFCGSILLFSNVFQLDRVAAAVVPTGNLVFGFAIPLLLFLVSVLRRKQI